MPLSVKIFFGLCVALAGMWLFKDYMLLAIAPAPLATAVKYHFLLTGMSCAIALSLAWMAAFRRQNWARWTLTGLIVAARLVPLLIEAVAGRLIAYVRDAVAYPPTNPLWYAVLMLEIAAVVLVLSPNAEPWFRRDVGT